MTSYPEALDHILAAWNEPDTAQVRSHLEKSLDSNVRFFDPSIDVTGIDGFLQNVHEVKSKIPGAVYSRTGGLGQL